MDSPAPFLLSSFPPLLFFSLPLPYASSPFLPDVFFPPVLSAFAHALVAFELPVLFFVATKGKRNHKVLLLLLSKKEVELFSTVKRGIYQDWQALQLSDKTVRASVPPGN